VEGNYVEPLVVDSIQIYAGQRYSFILNANQIVDNYWIFAIPDIGVTSVVGGLNSAILRYVGAKIADPTLVLPLVNPLIETNLHPLESPAAPGIPIPGAADVNLNLDIQFVGREFTINGATFIPPEVPVLLQIISGSVTAQSISPPGSIYVLPPNKTIEISMPGGSIGTPVSNKRCPFHSRTTD
jgi:iron transport multicopper oxidase